MSVEGRGPRRVVTGAVDPRDVIMQPRLWIAHLMAQLTSQLHAADPGRLRAKRTRDAVTRQASPRKLYRPGRFDERVPVVRRIDPGRFNGVGGRPRVQRHDLARP